MYGVLIVRQEVKIRPGRCGRDTTPPQATTGLHSRPCHNAQGETHILDVRSTLGDSAKNSRFIETLPRQGYGFIAPVSDPTAEAKLALELPSRKLVGRNGALAELRNCMEWSRQDHRQIVFVTGEPGIGKTALADEFLRRAASDFRGLRIARGQCVEGFGGKEAYYPMLEALGQLCRASGGDSVV